MSCFKGTMYSARQHHWRVLSTRARAFLNGTEKKNSGRPNFLGAKKRLSRPPNNGGWACHRRLLRGHSGWWPTDNGWPVTAGSWPATIRPGGVYVPQQKEKKKLLVSLRNVLTRARTKTLTLNCARETVLPRGMDHGGCRSGEHVSWPMQRIQSVCLSAPPH